MTGFELPAGDNTALPASEMLPPHHAFPLDINGKYFDVRYDPLAVSADIKRYADQQDWLSDQQKLKANSLADHTSICVNYPTAFAAMDVRFSHETSGQISGLLTIYPGGISKLISGYCKVNGVHHPDQISRVSSVLLSSYWAHERRHMIQVLDDTRLDNSWVGDTLKANAATNLYFNKAVSDLVQTAPLLATPTLSTMTEGQTVVGVTLFGLAHILPMYLNIRNSRKWFDYYGSGVEIDARSAQRSYLEGEQTTPLFEVTSQTTNALREVSQGFPIGTTQRGQVYTSGL